MEPLILANSKFSIDLLKVLCEGNTDDVFFSPLSISSALGLIILGAEGNTADQMYKTLHFGNMRIMYHDLYEELYKGGRNRSLKLVNHMFGERMLDFNDGYLDKCEEWCYASVRNVDFKTDPEAARKRINDWVMSRTEDQIQNLLAEGDVTKDTSLALISAVHFKDKWGVPFTKHSTNKDNAPKAVFRSDKNIFNLGDIPEADSRILELPYQNNNLSMIIMLPNQSDGLPKLIELITYEKIFEWTEPDNMLPTEVTVEMPVFKIQKKYDLEDALKTLGTTDLFSDECDLSGIAPGSLKLSKAVHKSSVEVNEKGTEADGGSSGVVYKALRKQTQPSFVVDHPFVFFIRHNPTKSILFWGRYSFNDQ